MRPFQLEREVKLEAGPDFVLPDLNGMLGGAVAIDTGERLLRAVYYDTADLRLIRSGITLRHRTEGDRDGTWTLKLPARQSGSDTVDRTEFDVAADPSAVPSELLDLIQVHARDATVERLAELQSRRRRVEIQDADGAVLAEIDDDEVTVLHGPAGPSRFREVEVELRPAAPRSLQKSVEAALVHAGARAGDGAPKAARAFGSGAALPPEADPVGIRAKTASVGEVVRMAIASGVTRLMRHDPGMRLDTDPEAVHQARVATRRLRSDLRTFKQALDREWVQSTRDELKWLGRSLGEVRDRDVLLERLETAASGLAPADAGPAGELLGRLRRERSAALAAAQQALRSPRYRALVDRLVEAASRPPLTGFAATPAHEAVSGLVRGSWKKLRRGVSALPDEPSDTELHQIRILAKRARYASEAVEPVVGKRAARLARALADLQTVLGDLHDAVVAEQWLRDAVRRAPAQAVVAGELIAVERASAAADRRAWPGMWKRAAAKKRVGWLKP